MTKLMFSVVPFDVRREHIEKLFSCDFYDFVLKHKGERLYGLRVSWEEKSYSSHDRQVVIDYVIPESVLLRVEPFLNKGRDRDGEITFSSHKDEEDLLDLFEDLEIQGDIVDVTAEE